MRQRQRTSRTTNGVTTAAAAAATAAAVDENQGQHIVHPVAVRSKIPLKRKVREAKEKRAGRKGPSSALAVFRKSRKHRGDNGAERRRRSGVVNTKDKVRHWLERENPTRENVDSDNESHFPEEEIPARRNPETARQQSQNCETSAAKPVKMMRSISENPREINGRHNFSRSISHGHEPDFSRLGRKTESHSHLLSKSESLDLEAADKSCAVDSTATPQLNGGGGVTHPSVQKRIPPTTKNSKIPKSATEGHLPPPSGKTKKFASFEFLNLITRKSAQQQTENKAKGPSRVVRHQEDQDDSTSTKMRKKIGLGPVKVVLKWHGAGRASRAAVKRPAKKETSDNNNKRGKKKRVIVYKNGDPTAGASSFPSAGNPADQPKEMEKDVVVKEMNIIANPLDSARSAEAAVFRSRRYSVQQQPPPLVRRVSEIHTSSQQPNNNNRRNRHSWTVGTLPEIHLASDIGIDIDQEDC